MIVASKRSLVFWLSNKASCADPFLGSFDHLQKGTDIRLVAKFGSVLP